LSDARQKAAIKKGAGIVISGVMGFLETYKTTSTGGGDK